MKEPQEWLKVFQQVNRDCSKSGESVVPFSDIEYYAGQIHCLTDEKDYASARFMAAVLSDL